MTAGKAQALMAKLAGNPSAAVRRATAAMLGRLEPTPAVVAALGHALLGDPDPGVRAAAARVCGSLGSTDVTVPLLHALEHDRDRNVRCNVIAALGKMRTPAAQVALTERLVGDGDALVRALAATGLAGVMAPEATAALLTALRTDPDRSVRFCTIQALQGVTDAAVVAVFVEMVRAKSLDPDIRADVARWLGASGTLAGIDALVVAVEDVTAPTDERQTAILALSQCRSHTAVRAALVRIRDGDPDPELRRSAAQVLDDPPSPGEPATNDGGT